MFCDIYSGLAQLATAKSIKGDRIFWKIVRDIEKYFNREAPSLLMYEESKLMYMHQKIEKGRLVIIELCSESLCRGEEP
jgi:hypothetical protein